MHALVLTYLALQLTTDISVHGHVSLGTWTKIYVWHIPRNTISGPQTLHIFNFTT